MLVLRTQKRDGGTLASNRNAVHAYDVGSVEERL